MNIAEILLQRAAQWGDAAAIVDVHRGRDRSHSFREFDRATAGIAGQLRAAGLEQSEGVLLLHPVAAELYLVLVALFRLGCVAIFLDPSAGRAHIERCCTIFPPKAFFGSLRAQFLRLAVPALRHIPKSFGLTYFPGSHQLALSGEGNVLTDIVSVRSGAPCLVTFTSGSTGEPKAALRTHGFLLAQHRALDRSLDLQPGTRDLTTLPIFVLANLGSGVTSILPDADLRSPGAIDPLPVLSQIQRHNIDTTAMSPAFLSRILSECESKNIPIPQLRRIYLGGAPVFPSALRKTKRFCPNAVITAVYGSTEAEPMAEIPLGDITDGDFRLMQEGSGLLAGAPVSSISLRVIRDQWGKPIASLDTRQFEQLGMAFGEPGEIVVSGAHVLPGYLHGEGNAETKFDVDGTRWHRTGDLGYLDPRGRLWLLGRCSAKIRDNRGTLYPFAVECAAMDHPEVNRAALVSILGRRVLAVETQSSVSPEKIQQSLAWAQLNQVLVVDHLPVDKRHNAKIDYVALARKLSSIAR